MQTWQECQQQFLKRRGRLSNQARNFEAYQKVREQIRKRQIEAEKQKVLEELNEIFEMSFFEARNFYNSYCSSCISADEFEVARAKFIQAWASDHLNSKVPDHEQAAAIGAVDGHVQVIARAGSGKTTTLVQRAVFIQKHCSVLPEQMLLLAFNTKAAGDVKEELAEHLGDEAPNALTFHALAHSLVQPDKVLVDEAKGEKPICSRHH